MSTIAEEVQNIWNHNLTFFPPTPRKVIVQRAGGLVKARYEGRKSFVFGVNEKHATKRLKTWDGAGRIPNNNFEN